MRNIQGFFLQLLSFHLNKTENRVILKAYGSAAEDLKCYECHDLGDMDIMIFPNSDNLTIHEELLEYSVGNPLHVRIKGCGHPVLQACLVEDTGYVATSTLKNFHPVIFGSESPWIVDVSTRVFQSFLREEFSPIVTGGLSNHCRSPAITLNFSRALAITSDQQKIMQNQASNVPFSLSAVDIEWMTSMVFWFKGIEYTRQHAKLMKYLMRVLDPIFQFQKLPVCPQENFNSDEKTGRRSRSTGSESPNETEHCVTMETNDEHCVRNLPNSSVASMPSNDGYVMAKQDCANCDEYQIPVELQSIFSRFTEISPLLESSFPSFSKPRVSLVKENEGKAKQEEVEKSGKHSDLDENQSKISPLSLRQEKEVNFKALPGSSDCTKEKDEKRREAETKRTGILDKRCCQSLKKPPRKEQNGSEGLEGSNLDEEIKNGDSIHDTNGVNGEGQQMTKKGEESSKDLTQNHDSQEGNEQERERRIQHHLLEHIFGTAKGVQTQKANVKNAERAQSGIDFIPALRSREWPKVAREWIERERKWPSPDIVKKVIQEGYHLVVKSPKMNGNPDYDFRISFSHAEYLLSQEMNDIQRDCYRCLKKISSCLYVQTTEEFGVISSKKHFSANN